MTQTSVENLQPSGSNNLARVFSRLGWMGFWVQVLMGSLSALLIIYMMMFSRWRLDLRAGLLFVEYLTIAGLLMLAFTTFWSYRYARLAKRLADPQSRPSQPAVIRVVWTGLIASGLGILFLILVMLIETARLLFYFLATPQAGVPVFQNPGVGSTSWVSAVDMVSLLALILTMIAEMVMLAFSLWLLFRVTQSCPEEFTETTEDLQPR